MYSRIQANRNTFHSCMGIMQGISKSGQSIKNGAGLLFSLTQEKYPSGDIAVTVDGTPHGGVTSLFVDTSGDVYAANSQGYKFKWNGKGWGQISDAEYIAAKALDVDNIPSGGSIMSYLTYAAAAVGGFFLVKKMFFGKEENKK